MTPSNVQTRQAPLRKQYQNQPESAWVTDSAITTGKHTKDPYHSEVMPMPETGVTVPIGVHQAVGGLHDAPTPGDLLCAALAACQDSTLRMVANILGVELLDLRVEVTARVDVRGTLLVDPGVPIGFQEIQCRVDMDVAPETSPRLLTVLQETARNCCVIQQTLKSPPSVSTHFYPGSLGKLSAKG